MERNNSANHPARQSKLVPIGAAIFAALFTGFAFLSLALPLKEIVFQPGSYNWAGLPVSSLIAVAAILGLRWMVRRYDVPRVQAGASVGIVVTTVVNVYYAWIEFSDLAATEEMVVLSIPVALILVSAGGRLITDPDSTSGEPTGVSLIWRSLSGRERSSFQDDLTPLVEDESSQSDSQVTTLDVFFSYDSDDRLIVYRIKDGIEARAKGAIDIYTYEDDLQPGEPVSTKAKSRINDADLFLVLITPNSQDSAWVQQEVGFAEGKVQIVPILVEAPERAELKGLLGGKEYLTFAQDSPNDFFEEFMNYAKHTWGLDSKGDGS